MKKGHRVTKPKSKTRERKFQRFHKSKREELTWSYDQVKYFHVDMPKHDREEQDILRFNSQEIVKNQDIRTHEDFVDLLMIRN